MNHEPLILPFKIWYVNLFRNLITQAHYLAAEGALKLNKDLISFSIPSTLIRSIILQTVPREAQIQ